MAQININGSCLGSRLNRFEGWTNEQLIDYEIDLYDQEVGGADTWEERDEVLWEMNSRGMMTPTKSPS